MIFVNGTPFLIDSSSSLTLKENEILDTLMKHDVLVSASNSFKAIPERNFSVPKESNIERSGNVKLVYLFQQEYATVDRSLVDLVGTDEATTCVGIAIWNPRNRKTSFAHMDSPKIVDMGLDQMLSKLVDINFNDDDLEVHIVGAFEDVSPNLGNSSTNNSENETNLGGYSNPLCSKIVETLRTRREKFHLKTLCVLSHNTKRDSEGTAYPVFTGFVVETSTGSIIPSRFDSTSRGPDDVVRRIRVTSSYEDPNWKGKLLETYDTKTDTFKIAACHWTDRQKQIARFLVSKPDSEVLRICSTSPLAESPDFVENHRRIWEYLIQHPDWRETFPDNEPRIFERNAVGSWTKRC